MFVRKNNNFLQFLDKGKFFLLSENNLPYIVFVIKSDVLLKTCTVSFVRIQKM